MNALERLAPHITGLAAEVLPGSRIHYRAKTYWLGDLQLTYSVETTAGRQRDLGAPTSKANVALAERILRACLGARAQPAWGTPWERQRRVLIGLREDTLPAFLPRHYCHWRHESLDDGWLFRSFHGSLRAHAGLRLVGGRIRRRPRLEHWRRRSRRSGCGWRRPESDRHGTEKRLRRRSGNGPLRSIHDEFV